MTDEEQRIFNRAIENIVYKVSRYIPCTWCPYDAKCTIKSEKKNITPDECLANIINLSIQEIKNAEMRHDETK